VVPQVAHDGGCYIRKERGSKNTSEPRPGHRRLIAGPVLVELRRMMGPLSEAIHALDQIQWNPAR
jgi:hypothetical protein